MKNWRGIAADGLADYLEERSQSWKLVFPLPKQALAQCPPSELSIRNGSAAFRAESVGFDLAGDFLYSIVIPVNLMTFQARDIGKYFEEVGTCSAWWSYFE